jgi:hypothetical protein
MFLTVRVAAHTIRYLWAEFLRAAAESIYSTKPVVVEPPKREGKWGDLIDPPSFCGECIEAGNTSPDGCECLLRNIALARAVGYGIEGFNIDQLRSDIEELEHSHGSD